MIEKIYDSWIYSGAFKHYINAPNKSNGEFTEKKHKRLKFKCDVGKYNYGKLTDFVGYQVKHYYDDISMGLQNQYSKNSNHLKPNCPISKWKEMKMTQKDEGVIKISQFYMSEITTLCEYVVKNTKDINSQHMRAKRILDRIEKYLIQTGKNREIFNKFKDEPIGRLPI